MTREEMRYKLNELRMMLNDGEHGEEQGVLVEIISELDKWEEPPIYTLTSNTISALSENKGEWKMPIQDDGMSDPIYYQVRCSKCGFDLDPQTWHQELHQYGADNFCPNCGADMRGDT